MELSGQNEVNLMAHKDRQIINLISIFGFYPKGTNLSIPLNYSLFRWVAEVKVLLVANFVNYYSENLQKYLKYVTLTKLIVSREKVTYQECHL